VGVYLLWKSGSLRTAAIIWTAAFVVSLIGYFVPAFMRLIYVGLMCVSFPIGWIVSHLILAVIFYLVFTPIGLIMRLFGRDPMQRSFEPSAKTYWVSHNPGGNTARYFKQF